MADAYKQPDNIERDNLDCVLDAALAKYAAVEPRAGVEQRVLANLRAEQAKPRYRNLWQLAAVAALASLIVVAVLAWRPSRSSRPVAMRLPVATPQTTHATAPQFISKAIPPRRTTTKKKAISQRPTQPFVATMPKLDQFPSPQPLTEQELALARYAQSFPGEATLIAQAQQEFELEIQKEMNDAGSESRPSGSTQQER